MALGTIVAAGGLIVTKASQLSAAKLECRLADGRKLADVALAAFRRAVEATSRP